jgi:hypothetical protein
MRNLPLARILAIAALVCAVLAFAGVGPGHVLAVGLGLLAIAVLV